MVGLLESIPSGVVWRCGQWTMDKEDYTEVMKKKEDTDWKDWEDGK